MQLDPKTLDRLIHAASRQFERIERHFAEFKESLEWFKEPRCPLRQVKVEPNDDSRCVAVSFGTTKVVIRLLLVLPEGEPAKGQVVCTRSQPKFSAIDPIITSFTFDAQGYTSFDVGVDREAIEMGRHAVDIVMHVIEMASRPLNPPSIA